MVLFEPQRNRRSSGMGLNAFLLLLLSCLSLGAAFTIHDKDTDHNSTTQCQTISMQTKDVRHLTETAKRLNQYLDMTLVKGQKTLDKVLSAFGVSKSFAVNADPEEPLESFLLQALLSMHRETMESLSIIQGHLGNSVTPATSSKSLKSSNSPSLLLSNQGLYRPTDYAFRPADCSEILVAGKTENEIYEIYPFRCRCSKPVKVLCDMETDGGGWTVILLRDNVSKPVNFTRNWEDYKNGFGDPKQEYWLGNAHLHTMTFNRNYVLRLEAKDGNGREVWGQWNAFTVDSEQNKYKLTSTKEDPKGTAYDGFTYHNNMFFSTFDRDHDKDGKTNCAVNRKGGWWFNACYKFNPTGDNTKNCHEGPCFHPWSKTDKTTRKAEWIQLKIRPSICATQISTASLNTHNCDSPK